MDKIEVISKMCKATYFRDFSDEERNYFAEDESLIANFKEGDYIIREAVIDKSVFVLLKGKAAVTKDSAPDIELNELGEGDMFGAFALVTNAPRTTNVIAKEDVTVFRIEGLELDNLDPATLNKFKNQLIRALISKIDEMNQAALEIKTEFDQVMETCEYIKKATDNFIVELSGPGEKG